MQRNASVLAHIELSKHVMLYGIVTAAFAATS